MAVRGVLAQLRTVDMDRAIDFYVNTLGFALEFRYQDFYAGIAVGDGSFHLKLSDEPDPSIRFVAEEGHFHLYFPVDDAVTEASRLKLRGVNLRAEVADTAWQTREFQVEDPDGHVLYFGQALPDAP